MHRYNSASSISSHTSGLFSSPTLNKMSNRISNKIASDKDIARKISSSGIPTTSSPYCFINNSSTPCDFIRKRERTRSSLYSLDDGNDSGVYDRLKTSIFKHTRTPSIISTNEELEQYDLTLNDDVPSLYEQPARKLTYSALSLQSTSSASSTSCINSNSLESEPSPKIKKITSKIELITSQSPIQNISSKNTTSPSETTIVYDDLFYKELDKLQTEFTDITSIMSIVDARLDNILCNTELTLKTQHRQHHLLDNLELDVGKTKQDCERLEWMQNRQSRMDDLRREKQIEENIQNMKNESENKKNSKHGFTRRSRELSAMPNVDRFLDEYYLTLNPKLPEAGQRKNTNKISSKPNPAPKSTGEGHRTSVTNSSTSGFESTSFHRKRQLDKKNSKSKQTTNRTVEKSRKGPKKSGKGRSDVPASLEYDTAHMDAVISQALASCQKKPSMRKRMMNKLMKSGTDSSSGYRSYAGFANY